MRTNSLNLNAWDSMLPSTDPEFQFNIEGIRNGFSIIDYFPEFTEALCCDNYRSALSNTIKVENVIKSEISNGNYVITKIKPLIISALGCVPKGSNSVRLIHDASMPSKHSINNFVNKKSCSYMDLRHACKLIKHNNFLCKVDLKNAYRSVRIHKSNFKFTGLHWKFEGDSEFTYFYDTKLPFGASKSPSIFQSLSSPVCRIMKLHDVTVIANLYDFLIIDESYERCKDSLEKLLRVLRMLGFHINYDKIVRPAQRIVFLGVLIDTVDMTLSLPDDKFSDFYSLLHTFSCKRRATKRQLESLIGSLNWASQVIQGGRPFLRRMIDLKNTLVSHSDKVILNDNFFC